MSGVAESVKGTPETDAECANLEAAFGRLCERHGAHHGPSPVLRAAFELAGRAHAGQRRRSGEPYLTHPLAVAGLLADYGADTATVAAGILHDVVEDSPVTLEDIAAAAGREVADLVDGVTKLDRAEETSREQRQADALRKLVVAMANDLRVLLVKLADRLHNVRTLEALPSERQQAIAAETLDVYAPLAHRLGAQDIKHELEDRCFQILHPARFAELDHLIAERAPHRDKVISQVLEELLAGLGAAGLGGEVHGRPKRHYSIFRKMVASGLAFDEIHDLIGIRVVVADIPSCYTALGVVHGAYQPLHGRFKDYVATPKFNLYQSLHTTVIGPDGRALEVQIRSRRMHELAEFGIAAHWRYKEGPPAKEVAWAADLSRLHGDRSDPDEFLRSLKMDLYHDEIFVVTPRGDMITLPQGATPVDFAYTVHTEIGNRCIGARVNGRVVPLDTPLRSGDVVEVLTSNRVGVAPSKDWVRFASTPRARHGIRQWYHRQRRSDFLGPGRVRVEEAFAAEGLDPGPAFDELIGRLAPEFGFRDRDALLIAVGEETLSPAAVAARAAVVLERDVDEPPAAAPQGAPLLAAGFEGLSVRLARCCSPEPGDGVVGFLTAGRGVSAHRSDCLNVGSLDATRVVELIWDGAWAPRAEFRIRLEALDRAGLLAEVTAAIAECGGFVGEAAVRTDAGVADMDFAIRVADADQAGLVLDAVRALGGVFEATLEPR